MSMNYATIPVEMMEQVMKQNAILNDMLHRLTLDNLKADTGSMSEENDMGKRIKQHVNIGGEMHWITADTQQAMFDAYLTRAIEKGVVSVPSKQPKQKEVLFKDFAVKYFETFHSGDATNTKNNRAYMLNKHILPKLGNMHINDITTELIQAWFNDMETERHYAKGTFKKIKNTLSPVLNYAIEKGILAKNPFKSKSFSLPGRNRKIKDAIPSEKMQEVRNGLHTLDNDDERRLMALLCYTGMRPEEAYGLRWEDIGRKTKTINIRRAVTHPDRNRPEVKGTKTGRTRKIPVQKVVLELLAPFEMKGYILGGKEPYNAGVLREIYKRVQKRFALYGYSPKDFRDTCATEWIENGMPLYTVSKMLGHTNTKTTEDHYLRFREKSLENARDIMRKIDISIDTDEDAKTYMTQG